MEHKSNKKRLGVSSPEYSPNDNDILLGRSSFCYNYPGNIRFRKTIEAHASLYNQNNYMYSRKEKTRHVYYVIDVLRSQGSRFLRYENGTWKQVGMRAVREKVGHALRDQSTTQHAQQSRQKGNGLSKQNDGNMGQTYGVMSLVARQQPSALELQHFFSDNTSSNNVLGNKNKENNPMVAAAGSLPTMNNGTPLPLALPGAPPAIGGLLGSWSGHAPPLTAAVPLHQTVSTGALPGGVVHLPGTAVLSAGTLTATLSTDAAAPAALPATSQSETLMLIQQSVQQLSQVEHFYNNLRSNIETTVNLLQQVGESTSQQHQQLSQQHRELSHQLLKQQQQSTDVAVPNGNKSLVRLPWEDDQQPSLSIKVNNKAATSWRRNNNNNPKKSRRQLGPDEVSSKSNQVTEGIISLLVSDGDDGAIPETISSAPELIGRW